MSSELTSTPDTYLSAIISSMGEGLVVVDSGYRITLINPAALRLLGFKKESEILGKDFREAVPIYKGNHLTPDEKRPIKRVIEHGESVVFGPEDNLYYKNSSGGVFPAASATSPIWKDGKVAGAVVIFRDITIEKRYEEAQSNFIAIASHQLRTPLTSMRWFSEMLLGGDAGALSPEQRHFLDRVYKGIDRMTKLVSILLRLAHAESGKIKIDPVSNDLKAVTENIIRSFGERASAHSQTINFVTKPELLPPVAIDEEGLQEVLSALIDNALSYSPEKSQITVSIIKNEKWFEFSVQDQGIGIAPENQQRIFESFFREENAVNYKPDGWGLDLLLARYMVESWGGKIWFESEQGRGSTFHFSIPAQGMKETEGWNRFYI